MSQVELIVSEANAGSSEDTSKMVPSIELNKGREVACKTTEGRIVITLMATAYFPTRIFNSHGCTQL